MKRAREAGTLLCGDFIGKVMEKALKTSRVQCLHEADRGGTDHQAPAVWYRQCF